MTKSTSLVTILSLMFSTAALPVFAQSGQSGSTDRMTGSGTSAGGSANTGSSNTTVGTNRTTGSANMQTGSSGWDAQNSYWRENYRNRPYYNSSRDYNSMQPAYRYGVDMYVRNNGRSFDELDQSELQSGWKQARGNSNLSWEDAKAATRDAYNRMGQSGNGSAGTNSSSGTTSGAGNTGTSNKESGSRDR